MRKLHVLWMSSLLLVLTACMPVYENNEEIVQESAEDSKNQTAIVPKYSITDKQYKMILTEDGPKPAAARGVIVSQISNRLDVDELETGLLRHSKEYFSPESHYFQAGQYLDENEILSMIDGLNPPREELEKEEDYRKNPRVLSHILEQNFLTKNDEGVAKLSGISIGLALKSTYDFQTEIGGPTYHEDISKKDMVAKGKQYAAKVLEKIRKTDGLKDIPVMIALYREEESGAMVPGNFVMKAYVKGGASKINDWEEINEDHILFPSSEAEEKHFEDTQLMSEFREEVSQYFPNFVGFIGDGFYINGNMRELSIDIPIQFYSKSEVVGFTQYVYGLVVEMLPDDYLIEVNIHSNKKPESVIIKEPGKEEPNVHIY
ncbi:CamS family sex pheromone protein [Thalassobacillus pellis]|uniref:CamS family sex pheromone protein n=1 Tax=Thalassobacillus pellis TaxID=748008 RepID=UPI001960162E|nr:CamS family sex pheromone protein [Thalassobacillus pellis]MBM7553418.1 protein involved in sex pheromone biosynthesis [Thalassobacillus pellis]